MRKYISPCLPQVYLSFSGVTLELDRRIDWFLSQKKRLFLLLCCYVKGFGYTMFSICQLLPSGDLRYSDTPGLWEGVCNMDISVYIWSVWVCVATFISNMPGAQIMGVSQSTIICGYSKCYRSYPDSVNSFLKTIPRERKQACFSRLWVPNYIMKKDYYQTTMYRQWKNCRCYRLFRTCDHLTSNTGRRGVLTIVTHVRTLIIEKNQYGVMKKRVLFSRSDKIYMRWYVMCVCVMQLNLLPVIKIFEQAGRLDRVMTKIFTLALKSHSLALLLCSRGCVT